MNIKTFLFYIVFQNLFTSFYSQEQNILNDLKENGIELIIDSSEIINIKNDTSFFIYYHMGDVVSFIQGRISNQKIFYYQSNLLKAKILMNCLSLIEVDTTKLINVISSKSNGIKQITFKSKFAYSGTYNDQLLDKNGLPFMLNIMMFKYDNNEYTKFDSDSLVNVNWLNNTELDKYELMFVFESKEYTPKKYHEISNIDLWYKRIVLVNTKYELVSDDIRSKQHISYYDHY